MGTFADKVTTAIDDPGPLKIGIYGEPGCGKTVLSCQAPRPLLLDCEKGRRSLLNHKELWGTKLVKINTFEQLAAVPTAMMAKDPFFDEVDSISLDTITRAQRLDLINMVKEAHKANSNRHPYLPSEAEFNISNRKMERLILSFIEAADIADKTLIITCHVKEDKDDNGQTVIIRPDTSPGLVGSMVALLDAVFYMSATTDSKGVTVRKLRTVASSKLKGKNRLGDLPTEIIDPTFQQILDAANKQRELAKEAMNQIN